MPPKVLAYPLTKQVLSKHWPPLQGFVSPPVQLNMKDLALDRSADLVKSQASKGASTLPNGAGHMATTSGPQPIGSAGLEAEELQPAGTDTDAAGSSGPPDRRKDEPEVEDAAAPEIGPPQAHLLFAHG